MDGLKKNLHFVVFGAGVLLGVIFLFVGISMRGGTEEKLDQSLGSLGTLSPPTEGDVNAAKKVRAKFDSSMKDAESTLKGRGKALTQGFDPSQAPDEFYTDDATGTLRDLDARFAAMRKDVSMPDPLTGRYRIEDREKDNTFWKDRDGEMATLRQEQVKEYWIRLRIMEEFATICERLLEAGAGDGMGVRLITFNFEALTTVGNQDELSPWVVMPWSVQLECSPGFSVLLLSELTSPSELTMGGDENPRRGFPNLLTNYQTQLKGRPDRAKFKIDNDYKKKLGFTEELDPESNQGKSVIGDVETTLEEELTLVQPVKVGMRMQAAMYNEEWRPMVEPVEE
jgi:hypothetical protein